MSARDRKLHLFPLCTGLALGSKPRGLALNGAVRRSETVGDRAEIGRIAPFAKVAERKTSTHESVLRGTGAVAK